MPIPSTMADLSTTAASNSPAGTDSPTSGDDYLRSIQAIIRTTNAKGADIASASTTDIGAATGEFVDITGTTTITSLGTVAAGIVRTVRFTGALTLTHNATSLQLPSGANITTANGDVAQFRSLGSGNWKCVNYLKSDGTSIVIADNSITTTKILDANVTNAKLAADVFSTAHTWSDAQSFTANALVTSGTAGIGYGTGAGGTVTQATSKSTAVTLNKPTGRITMATSALAAGATVGFQVNNSVVAITDTVSTSVYNNANYSSTAYYTASGAFGIRVTNISAGSLSEAVNISFCVIKGVDA